MYYLSLWIKEYSFYHVFLSYSTNIMISNLKQQDSSPEVAMIWTPLQWTMLILSLHDQLQVMHEQTQLPWEHSQATETQKQIIDNREKKKSERSFRENIKSIRILEIKRSPSPNQTRQAIVSSYKLNAYKKCHHITRFNQLGKFS